MTDLPPAPTFPLLVLAGALGGFMNSVAGGASLVVFPVLVLIGLEPRVANATNNLATTLVAFQSCVDYSRRGFQNTGLIVRLAGPSLVGARFGAAGVILLSNAAFSRLVEVLMLLLASLSHCLIVTMTILVTMSTTILFVQRKR